MEMAQKHDIRINPQYLPNHYENAWILAWLGQNCGSFLFIVFLTGPVLFIINKIFIHSLYAVVHRRSYLISMGIRLKNIIETWHAHAKEEEMYGKI